MTPLISERVIGKKMPERNLIQVLKIPYLGPKAGFSLSDSTPYRASMYYLEHYPSLKTPILNGVNIFCPEN